MTLSVLTVIGLIVGAVSGVVSLCWIIFQWGRGSVSSPGPAKPDPSIAGTLQALADTQKQITDQIYLIAQVVRDLATWLRHRNSNANLGCVRSTGIDWNIRGDSANQPGGVDVLASSNASRGRLACHGIRVLWWGVVNAAEGGGY